MENKEVKKCSYCGKPSVYARGYCKNCYNRWNKYGSPERRKNLFDKCSCCGAPSHYAKGYCKACYARFHRKGTTEKTHSKLNGTIINGYRVEHIINTKHYEIKCINCGATRIVTRSIKRRCRCSYHFDTEHISENDEKYIDAFLKNDCRYTDAAKALGVSKQAVHEKIKVLEVKVEDNAPSVHITGDIHGNPSRIVDYCAKNYLTEKDTIIVLGDVGFNYFRDDYDIDNKEKASKLRATIFCVHGNHEIRPQNIPSYKTKVWNGGIVYYEDDFPNILFAKDGEVYDICGKKYFVLGGAYSVDKYYRVYRHLIRISQYKDETSAEVKARRIIEEVIRNNFKDDKTKKSFYNLADKICEKYQEGSYWWSNEQPDEEIKKYVEEQVEKHKETVFDIVLSHTCPFDYTPVEAFLPSVDQDTVDNSTEKWLNKIMKKIKFNDWYCGHWHINKTIDNMHFLFDDIVKVEGYIESCLKNIGPVVASKDLVDNKKKVGFMYYDKSPCSGGTSWCFFSGEESKDYINNPDNLAVYDIKTILEIDKDILLYIINNPVGSAFERVENKSYLFKSVCIGEYYGK